MLYTQIFQELYYQADFVYGGRLPIHVTFMLDEFANVALPDDFCSLLSTMRSREISSVIIIQNFAQLKALFKDTWETIPGNCDTFIYLGGNEQSTHKYVSELLGKGTIDKRSSGETKGKQGSSSRNYDVLGRELFTPDEVRKLDNKKCILFIRGFDPILDDKYVPFAHPRFALTADGEGEAYVHHSTVKKGALGSSVELLTPASVNYYKRLKERGGNVYIQEMKYEEFKLLGQAELKKRFLQEDEEQQKAKMQAEQEPELEYSQETVKPRGWSEKQAPKQTNITTEDLFERELQAEYSEHQKKVLRQALIKKIPLRELLDYYYPDVTVEEMKRAWKV